MKATTIFITYNPNIPTEQTLAIRLHTIGAVNGFRMYLPDRYNSDTILDTETQNRIASSDYVIMFSTTAKLSAIVKQEIEYAFQKFQDKSRIIVIYSTRRNLKGKGTEHFTEIYHNALEETTDSVIERILAIIVKKRQEQMKTEQYKVEINNKKNEIKKLKAQKELDNALIALLGIGLGLAVLAVISKD